MIENPFLSPRLRGGRFENGGIPFTVLEDLKELFKRILPCYENCAYTRADRLYDLINAGYCAQDIPDDLPGQLPRILKEFGRTLLKFKSIQLTFPNCREPENLTTMTRNILGNPVQIHRTTTPVCVRKNVTEFDYVRKDFDF